MTIPDIIIPEKVAELRDDALATGADVNISYNDYIMDGARCRDWLVRATFHYMPMNDAD